MRLMVGAPTVLATGLEYPEGPSVGPQGEVYVVEIKGGRVKKVAAGLTETHAVTGGGPNGSALGRDGYLYVANSGGFVFDGNRPLGRPDDYAGGSIQRISPDGDVETVATAFGDERLNAPNDLVFDGEDNLYFTDPGYGDFPGRIYLWTAAGKLSLVDGGYRYCNGLAISDDGSHIAIAESYSRRVYIAEITSPGKLGRRRILATLPERHFPDGLCYDSEGNLLVAGAGGSTIHILDSNGTEVDRVATEDPFVTNLAFGGDDMRTLYATESSKGRLVAFEWPIPGMRLFPDRRRHGDS